MASLRFEYTTEEKEKLDAFAKSQGVSKAKVLCWLISKLPGQALPSSEPPQANQKKEHQLRLRLTSSEYRAIAERTNLDQWQSPSAWVYSLVSSHINSTPVLTDNELAQLNAVERQLRKIGNNINQIAKAANVDPRNAQQLASINLEALSTLVNQAIHLSEDIQTGAAKRWSLS